MVVDNQTISCVSPPSETGTLVPLSVTLNRQVAPHPTLPYPAPYPTLPSPFTLHHKLRTPNPEPFNLNSKPSTINQKPVTLHP